MSDASSLLAWRGKFIRAVPTVYRKSIVVTNCLFVDFLPMKTTRSMSLRTRTTTVEEAMSDKIDNKENGVKSNDNEMTEHRTGIGVDPISGDNYDDADGEEFLRTTTRRISDGNDVAEKANEQPASAADQSGGQGTARAAKMLPYPVRILDCRTAGIPGSFCADWSLCRSSRDSRRQSLQYEQHASEAGAGGLPGSRTNREI